MVVALAAGGCSGSSDTATTSPAAEASTTRTETAVRTGQAGQRVALVLGISWEGQRAELVRVDPRSLRPIGRETVRLGRHAGSRTFAPDGSRLALGTAEDPARLRVIDLEQMRALGDVGLGRGSVEAVAWLSPKRLVAAIETPNSGLVLATVDPAARRVLGRRALEGSISALGRLPDRLVLLLSPRGTIGPARLATIDAEGGVHATTLTRTYAGINLDEDSEGGIGEGRDPGLAIDTERRQAYVVGAGEAVAKVDLDRLSVSYHSLAEPVSLLERLRNWLEPTAEAKGVRGPSRHARWLGGDLLAVSGYDDETYIDSSGTWHYEGSPAGLTLIGTRDWSTRTIDEKTDSFWFVSGTLVTLNEDGAVRGYTVDGRRTFAFPGLQPIGVVLTARRYAYVFRMDNSVEVIDVRAQRIVGRVKTDVQSVLADDVVDW
jgi:hypothetical protein